MNRILFIGGGSVGHIAPAVAVWRALHTMDDAWEEYFVCSFRGEDGNFLRNEEVSFEQFDAPRINWLYPIRFWSALKHAREILDAVQPDIILSKGGYVSVPFCIAAKKKGIPIVLHESDAVSGRANKLVSKFASAICIGIPSAEEPIPHAIYTGNPVRPEVTRGSKKEALRITGLSGTRPIFLVIGGSQGAKNINTILKDHLTELTEFCDIIHITGRGKAIAENNEHYWSAEFVVEELPHLYACADLALSRAGAGSIGELAANKLPMILVPLRGVGHDHQQQNALSAAKSGECIVLQENNLATQLVPVTRELLNNQNRLKTMSDASFSLYHPEAALQIAKIISDTLAEKRGDH